MKGRGAWHAAVHGVAKGQTQLSKNNHAQRKSGEDGTNNTQGEMLSEALRPSVNIQMVETAWRKGKRGRATECVALQSPSGGIKEAFQKERPPTPGFLPGQRSLAGPWSRGSYSPWGH